MRTVISAAQAACSYVIVWLALSAFAASQDLTPGATSWNTLPQFSGARRLLSYSNDTTALLVPLGGRRGAVLRGRKLMRAASVHVNGSVREVGYFYATLGLGTPSRDYQLIIDTGSTVTYVPCSDCKHCGKHIGQPFDIKQSSTAVQLGCDSPKCNCGSPPCQCFQNKCFYARSYAEHSSSDGFLLEDTLAFPDVPHTLPAGSTAPPVKIVFGCERSETGEIYKQTADGILGLGNNNNALQSQLVEQKVIEDTFHLCFGFPHSGVMLLGDVKLSRGNEFAYTPMKPPYQTHYYVVTIEHMSVGDTQLPVAKADYAQGYGAVLDSGTTFTYLPTNAFGQFATAIAKAAEAKGLKRRPGQDPQYNDICWQGASADPRQLDEWFPTTSIVFSGGTVLPMRPLQYLFVMGGGSYCLGLFDNGNAGTLIGGISVRNVLVQYDRRHNRAGFLPLDSCLDVHRLVSDANPPQQQQQPPAVVVPSPSPSQSEPSQAPSGRGQAPTPGTDQPATDKEKQGGGSGKPTDTQSDGQATPAPRPTPSGTTGPSHKDPGSTTDRSHSPARVVPGHQAGSSWGWVVVVAALLVLAVVGGLIWRDPKRLEAVWHHLMPDRSSGQGVDEEAISLIDKAGNAGSSVAGFSREPPDRSTSPLR